MLTSQKCGTLLLLNPSVFWILTILGYESAPILCAASSSCTVRILFIFLSVWVKYLKLVFCFVFFSSTNFGFTSVFDWCIASNLPPVEGSTEVFLEQFPSLPVFCCSSTNKYVAGIKFRFQKENKTKKQQHWWARALDFIFCFISKILKAKSSFHQNKSLVRFIGYSKLQMILCEFKWSL